MQIKKSGSQSSGKGPAEYFTGTVRVDPLFDAPIPRAYWALALPLSQARGRHGIHTRSVRP
jgi:hypothetical protein